MKSIKEWIQDKVGITELKKEVKNLNRRILIQNKYIENKLAELKDYTRVDADVGFRGNNTIVLTGVYRNQAYVRFYDLIDGEFIRLVEMLKDLQKHSLIRNIDAPHNFRGTFKI